MLRARYAGRRCASYSTVADMNTEQRVPGCECALTKPFGISFKVHYGLVDSIVLVGTAAPTSTQQASTTQAPNRKHPTGKYNTSSLQASTMLISTNLDTSLLFLFSHQSQMEHHLEKVAHTRQFAILNEGDALGLLPGGASRGVWYPGGCLCCSLSSSLCGGGLPSQATQSAQATQANAAKTACKQPTLNINSSAVIVRISWQVCQPTLDTYEECLDLVLGANTH